MRTWRVFTPYFCRVMIEENPIESSRMKRFNNLTQEEVIEILIDNILRKWPDAEIKRTTRWNRPALDVSRDGTFHYLEPEIEPPMLYYIAQGI